MLTLAARDVQNRSIDIDNVRGIFGSQNLIAGRPDGVRDDSDDGVDD